MNGKIFGNSLVKAGFVAFALALGLAACGDGGSTNGPSNNHEDTNISSVESEENLPSCTESREGFVNFINGTKEGFVCKNRRWDHYDMIADVEENLPGCTGSREGLSAYLYEEKQTLKCVTGVWVKIGGTAGSGVAISSSSSPKPNSSSSEINGDNSGENGAFFITKNVTTSLSTMGTSTVTEIAYNYLDIQSQYLYETLYSMSMYSNDKLISSSISKAAYIKDGSSCGAGFDACNRICAGDVPFYVSGTQTCADIEFVGEVNSYKKYKISGDSYSYYDKDGVLRITESGSMKIEYYDKKVMDNFTYRCARTSQNGSLLYDACEEFKVLKSTNSNVSIQTSYTYSGMNVVNLVEYEYFKFGYTSNGITTNGSSSSVASSSSSSVIPGSSSSVIPGTDPGSSSSVASSSSMKAAWAYLNPNIDYGEFTDERDGQVYKTVKIGYQTWMAENLNYRYVGVKYDYDGYTSDSTSWCYDDKASNCDKYGRLYTWSAVMDSAGIVDPRGAGKGCGYDEYYCYAARSATKVRGICPEGWHVPTNEEYSTLYTYIGGSSTAGSLLKSTSGWYNSGNGTDKYGFSVLPAGGRYYNGDFNSEGNYAYLWSAFESNSYYVWSKSFYYDGDYAALDSYYFKNLGLSLRCLKDSGSVTSSSSVVSSSSTSVPGSSSSVIPGTDPGSSSSSMKAAWAYLNPDIDYGEFTDSRDGQVYKTVTIGTQIWMAENLNYAPTNVSSMGSYAWSGCYDNQSTNCSKYGRLYTWEVAMDDASCVYGNRCNPSGIVRGVCPSGWHLPTKEDWQKLVKPMASSVSDNATTWNYYGVGIELKTVDDWHSSSNKGTNASGFSALPAGYRNNGRSFRSAGYSANFWSASEYDDNYAYYLDLYYGSDRAGLTYYDKNGAFSVRCLKD